MIFSFKSTVLLSILSETLLEFILQFDAIDRYGMYIIIIKIMEQKTNLIQRLITYLYMGTLQNSEVC